MKTILVLCLLCASAIAYPASSQEDSNESEFINPITRKGVPSVVEVDVGDSDEDSFFFPSFFRPIFFNPFPSFKFGGFPSLFSTSAFGGFKNLFSGVPGDANVTNSTSTVKIVDGHKVTVNATVYEKNGAVFKSEVIEITRLDEPKEEGEEKSTEGPVKTDSNDEETPIKKNESPEETSVKDESLDNEILREEVSPPDHSDVLIA
ncbi:UNVERIFIED_CONTAM: hypothetical protein PYX00_009621 [Menopon gallinae]|uniref:Uncharacterized protein n=1 Tax=Menopon gallinae TaxID=328185 RepID=A0AAW2HC18_9NEOP